MLSFLVIGRQRKDDYRYPEEGALDLSCVLPELVRTGPVLGKELILVVRDERKKACLFFDRETTRKRLYCVWSKQPGNVFMAAWCASPSTGKQFFSCCVICIFFMRGNPERLGFCAWSSFDLSRWSSSGSSRCSELARSWAA